MRKLFLIIAYFLSVSINLIFAQEIFTKKLNNGLEIYVLENNSVPLTYIEVGCRTGANSQTPENAGLFHLYEHILFKGNEKFRSQKEFTAAMNSYGVATWNGSTAIDLVNYFFTVPSSKTKEGIEFWAYALRSPLFDEKEFENEKAVVISEIEGDFKEPSRILRAAFQRYLFPASPWRLDPSGYPENVKNATVEKLKAIKDSYYNPQNIAFFIGGDVKHEEVFSIIENNLGTWEGEKAPSLPLMEKKPFNGIKKLVYPNPKIMKGLVQAMYLFRGPDGEAIEERKDTYPADVLGTLLDNPSSPFKKIFTGNEKLGIPDSDYVSYSYSTQRFSGLQDFYAMMQGNESTILERSELFLETLTNEAIPCLQKTEFYNDCDIKTAKKTMLDSRTYSMEIPAAYLSGLVYMWACCDANYFFNYEKNIKKVKKTDLLNFARKNISNQNGLYIVQVNPETFKNCSEEFTSAGYDTITMDNAYWWKNEN